MPQVLVDHRKYSQYQVSGVLFRRFMSLLVPVFITDYNILSNHVDHSRFCVATFQGNGILYQLFTSLTKN